MIERQSKEVWDILEEVTKGHPVMLNRAPTLHRLSVQAFEPQLIEGEAIRIHPLVCTAYNADFDGDQMAVHVPLSVEAQMEARLLMMAPNNIFSPSSGKPIITPTQDITLGCYYLTAEPRTPAPADPRQLKLFGSKTEARFAFDDGAVKTHERIRLANPDFGRQTVYGDANKKVIETTVGRVMFSEIWPEEMGFLNKGAGKSQLGEMIWRCYKVCGHDKTVAMLDQLKELGFREATRAGVSIGIDDMIIPKEKGQEIEAAQKQIREVEKQYRKGVITPGERYNKIIDIWTHCTDQIANVMFKTLEQNQGKKEFNPVYLMVDSGARGNRQQVRQLAGVRGLMAKPSGDIIEKPILSNFREGLTVLEYFISTHGARKGLADTALKTADSGYMTRKLVDVAQDVIIREEDCGTPTASGWKPFLKATMWWSNSAIASWAGFRATTFSIPPIRKRCSPAPTRKSTRRRPSALKPSASRKSKSGRCSPAKANTACASICYGRNLATGKLVELGEATGIIAAQSIGEPGTQLTMRTFHIGGTAAQVFKIPQIKAKFDGTIRYNELAARPARGRQQHRAQQERHGLHSGRGRTRVGKPHRRHRRRHLRAGRRQGQERRDLRPVGSVQRPDSVRESGQGEVPRHHRGRHHEAGNGRDDRAGSDGRHRTQGGFASANHHLR